MTENILPAAHRTITGKKVKNLRREGKLPGVIYGPNMDKPLPITLDRKEATKLLVKLTLSSLITIKFSEKEEYRVLLKETQKDYIRGLLTHVDFVEVAAGELIRTNVVVEITGDAPAVKDYNGVLMQQLNALQVECMPRDLPSSFVVDISELEQIGESVFVRDIVTTDKITVFDDPDSPIVTIIGSSAAAIAAAEEEEEGLELIADTDEPEVIEKGKKEEDED